MLLLYLAWLALLLLVQATPLLRALISCIVSGVILDWGLPSILLNLK